MKKFIAAFDPLHFTESTMAYAIYLAKYAGAHLVGIFLEDMNRHSYSVKELVEYEGVPFEQHVHELNLKDDQSRQACVEKFRHACQAGGVTCTVHHDRNVPLQELLHESIYADLLIISPGETLERSKESAPTHFIRDLLEEVQCPVFLVPTAYEAPNRIVLLYDGEPSSVHALRTFSYLCESLKSLPTEVVTVKKEEDNLHVPAPKLIKEFVKRHFPNAEYTVLKGVPEDAIVAHLHRKKAEPIIVLGAYQRNRLSRLFRPSMADRLLEQVRCPLFVAHNRS